MTTAAYGVRVVGLKDLQGRLEKYPQLAQEVLRPAALASVIKVEGEVKRETPVHTGHLRSSISHRVVPIGNDIQGLVTTPVEYAPPVEFGRQPGTWPNIKAINRWAHLVLGDESAGFLVARAIFQRGIKPRAMFAKGLMASQSYIKERYRRARDELVRRLAGG
jgi:hypothetical protein